MPARSENSTKSPRIAFYGNFGAGNLGNEATLQAIIERIVRRWPDGRLLCFCTDPVRRTRAPRRDRQIQATPMLMQSA